MRKRTTGTTWVERGWTALETSCLLCSPTISRWASSGRPRIPGKEAQQGLIKVAQHRHSHLRRQTHHQLLQARLQYRPVGQDQGRRRDALRRVTGPQERHHILCHSLPPQTSVLSHEQLFEIGQVAPPPQHTLRILLSGGDTRRAKDRCGQKLNPSEQGQH